MLLLSLPVFIDCRRSSVRCFLSTERENARPAYELLKRQIWRGNNLFQKADFISSKGSFAGRLGRSMKYFAVANHYLIETENSIETKLANETVHCLLCSTACR